MIITGLIILEKSNLFWKLFLFCSFFFLRQVCLEKIDKKILFRYNKLEG